MTLGDKRRQFTALVARLLLKIQESGDEAALHYSFRSNEEQNRLFKEGKTKIRCGKSCHNFGLAVDINLYKGGVYQTSTKAHQPYGEWWEKQHPLARWGGKFGDGNHYSFEHNGVK